MMAALCVCGHPRSDHENRPGIFATWCLKKVRVRNNNDFCSCDKYRSAKRAATRRWAQDTKAYVLHLEEWNKRLVAWLERTDRNYRHLPKCKYDLLGTMKCSCGYDNLVKGLVWPEGKR